jgi:photosystem II stability/assembly factor-like uncharacterized protein
MHAILRIGVIAIGLATAASPAAAQWTRVTALPATDMFSVFAKGDTIAAGADTAVYVSTNAGATWKRSAKVAPGVTGIVALWVRNGRIFAGTHGQGVFVSDDLGDTWLGFNQGLVGAIFDTQLAVVGMLVRGDSLYLATDGGGPWVRNLAGAGTWSRFGDLNGDTTAPIMNDITASDSRLLSSGGGNGTVFIRDRGDANWRLSFLSNVSFTAGLGPLTAAWTGHGWVVGSNGGLFRSPDAQEPWTPTGPRLGILLHVSFATRGRELFADLGIEGGSLISHSLDDGVTWQTLDTMFGTFIYKLAVVGGSELYASRLDGLWHRSIDTVSVPGDRDLGGLRFALAGPQPVRDDVRFRFELPEAGRASIEVFDVAGRRAPGRVDELWSAGPHDVSWSARDLGPGIYQARLTAGGRHEVVRLVRVR